MVLYTKIIYAKLRGHHIYSGLDVYMVRVFHGTCSGMDYGSGAPECIKHSARYWMVK